MTNLLVPKVSITEVTELLAVPGATNVVIGVIGTSEKGTADQVKTVSSVSEAETIFGSNIAYGADLVPMIRKAFTEGASLIKAVSIGTPTMDAATALQEGALTADSAAGASTITVSDASIYTPGNEVYIGTGNTYSNEEKLIVDTSGVGTTVTFTTAFKYPHYIGETARIVTAKVDGDYTNSINAMEVDENKGIVVSESNSVAVAAAITTMCENSTLLQGVPCIYIQGAEAGDDATAVITKATTANNDRVIIPYPLLVDFNGNTISGGQTAASLAGLIVGNGLPKLNHNFSEFQGSGAVSTTITDMDALISGGITPIEAKYGTIHIVRFVTTSKLTDGVPDFTWREASIRINVDIIEKTITDAIRNLYMQKGNTPAIRESIKQKIISLLNIFAGNDILVADANTNTPAFQEPIVTVDANDSTKINIDISVSPGKPLNFISLNFKVAL